MIFDDETPVRAGTPRSIHVGRRLVQWNRGNRNCGRGCRSAQTRSHMKKLHWQARSQRGVQSKNIFWGSLEQRPNPKGTNRNTFNEESRTLLSLSQPSDNFICDRFSFQSLSQFLDCMAFSGAVGKLQGPPIQDSRTRSPDTFLLQSRLVRKSVSF